MIGANLQVLSSDPPAEHRRTMRATIQPSQLKGNILAPVSKSSMQRACAAALLSEQEVIIHHPGHSNDDKAAIGIITALGAESEIQNSELKIRNPGFPHRVNDNPLTINCAESGLSIRMFTPLAALCANEITITGEGSLLSRPMDFFDEILPKLGVKIKSNAGKLPLVIRGPLQPKNIEVDGSLSSQFLTGLLMAYSASGANDVSIKVNNLKSKPYIDLTLAVMKDFGMNVPENRNYEEFVFRSKIQHPTSKISYTVEGDWSGAAFLLVAGAIAGPIEVTGLDPFSTQADKNILHALMDCGAILSVQPDKIEIAPAALKAFHFNATDCPDLFPPLVALASYCSGTTVIEGVSRLAHKESNRALTLQEEFAKMAVEINLQDDLMMIKGGNGVKGAEVHSRHDHRIAMACAVAALKASAETTIVEAQAVNKSYPDFYEDLQKLNASVSLLK